MAWTLSCRHLAAAVVTIVSVASSPVQRNEHQQTQPQDVLHPDIRAVVQVVGEDNPGGRAWADSYSVGNRCYCATTLDHGGIGSFYVETTTQLGWLTVRQVCELLGPGPGIEEENEGGGNGTTTRPLYNDVQCGNGPPNDSSDEFTCPGRVDIGPQGCGQIGPKWNFDFDSIPNNSSSVISPNVALFNTTPPPGTHADILAVVNVTAGVTARPGWKDSYSVGNRCYCASNLDHHIRRYVVETPRGWKRVGQVCNDIIGEGPGMDGNPTYNDIQCGNGPPNSAGDEHACPGRTDIPNGCGQIGPRWNFHVEETTKVPTETPTPMPPAAETPVPSTISSVSLEPSSETGMATGAPTSVGASTLPSSSPFTSPLSEQSSTPSNAPIRQPSANPSHSPTVVISSAGPTDLPTAVPFTKSPSSSTSPSETPTSEMTFVPSVQPSTSESYYIPCHAVVAIYLSLTLAVAPAILGWLV